MKKKLILLLLALLFLVGCSSFCFGDKDKDKAEKEHDISKAEAIENVYLKKKEIIDFRKNTDPNYPGIVLNNQSILPESAIDMTINNSDKWLNIQPHLNQHIYKDVQDMINPQADAQKYINLLLSLTTDGKIYQAVVLETDKQTPFYPGKYIFISRKEIESCQDEAVLLELLSFRLVRNDFLNKNIDYDLFDDNDIRKSLTNIIEKNRAKWEKYFLDSKNNLNTEVTNKVAVAMIRAGFKPTYNFSLKNLPHFKSTTNPPIKSLEHISPLKRHKKVFD